MRAFTELDKFVKKEAVFAMNTLFFTIADLAKALQREDRFIGMHRFRPRNLLKAIALAYIRDNSEEVIQIMEGFCKRVGKVSVRVKDVTRRYWLHWQPNLGAGY